MKLITLSNTFYDKYQNCKEILQKDNRPYICLSVKIDDITFAIPFRHGISHKYSFITYGKCGLDYTKAIVLFQDSFVSETKPQIEQKEYNMIKTKENTLVKGMQKYLSLYKKAKQYPESKFYQNIIKYSSLQYFEEYFQ